MKSFVFSLQPILNVKISIEKEKKRALGRLRQKLKSLETERSNMTEMKMKMERDIMIHYQQEYFDANYIVIANNYIDNVIVQKIKELNDEIVRTEEMIQTATSELIDAMKEKKVLENLKEKRFNAFYKEYKRKVYSNIDELSVQRHNIRP